MNDNNWHEGINDDGETEYIKRIKLYGSCTLEMFDEISSTKQFSKNGQVLKLDAQHHKVALNNNGTCTVEQFGNLEAAERTYNTIRSTI